MNLLRSRFVICLGLLAISLAASAAEKSTFPRIAGMHIGSPHDYEDLAYQAALARYDLVVMSRWLGWEAGRNTTYEAVVRNIKTISPNTKILVYLNNNELKFPDTPPAKEDLRNKLDQMKWWLYAQGTGPNMVLSGWGTDFYSTNLSLYAPRDSNGDRWVEWFARRAAEDLYQPNPSIDGFYLDNVFWKPRVNGDWNRDGKIDDQDDPVVQKWYRDGLRRHFDLLKQLMPGKYQFGNVAWTNAPASLPELDNQLHGAFIENLIGPSYAAETWGGWGEMMKRYRDTIDRLAEPKIVMFNQWGDLTDYQGLRYGLGSCLLDDGYFVYSVWSSGFAAYRDVAWFDEFNVDLGEALDPPVHTPWSQGVYRRDFENGIVLVNPKGNGQKTVQLETDFRRIAGTQATAVNNGQLTRSVTLKDRDGIVLLRLNTVPRPSPPVSVRAQ